MSVGPGISPPLRLFVVEDHADTLIYLRMFLESVGHQVSTASTMAEALAAFPQSQADVLISDVGLPDGDGWELLRRLRSTGPVYAIAMSGFGTPEEQAKSREAGFRRHFVKPFHPADLESALKDAAKERKAGG